MKKSLILLGAAILALVSCAKTQVISTGSPSPIAFKAVVNNAVKADAQLEGINLGDDYAMYVSAAQYKADGTIETPAYFTDAEFLPASTPVAPETMYHANPQLYWPIGNAILDFVAYAMPQAAHGVAPVAAFPAATDPVASMVTFAGWNTYDNQVDLLYAVKNSATTLTNAGAQTVNFSFKHAQALLVFQAQVNDPGIITINSITIPELKVNGDFKAYRFATCSTAAATAGKTITLESSVTLEAGLIVYVKFANTNSAAVANLTLAITAPTSATDSTAVTTTAKPIKYRGANLPAVGYLAANRTYPFVYDGTNWELVGDLDTNTHNNTFSKVKVGSTTIEADSGADTLELVAGTNVTLTPDSTNDKVTITSSDTDTKNTAGSTDSSSKLFLVGATSQAANPQTYSQDTAYVGTDGHLYSNSVQVVNLSGSQALTNKTYNGYTLAAACAKAVVTSVDTSASLPTSGAVKTYVDNSVSTATAGALQYKGTVAAESTITGAAYKKGWYYVVSTAGTYLGKVCEVGDMLIAKQDKTSTPANDWDAVQSNIEVLSNSEIDALWAAA